MVHHSGHAMRGLRCLSLTPYESRCPLMMQRGWVLQGSGLSLRKYGLIVLHIVRKVFPSSVLHCDEVIVIYCPGNNLMPSFYFSNDVSGQLLLLTFHLEP